MATREFGSTQCSVDAIDAHWNLHWAIRLLNRFESRRCGQAYSQREKQEGRFLG